MEQTAQVAALNDEVQKLRMLFLSQTGAGGDCAAPAGRTGVRAHARSAGILFDTLLLLLYRCGVGAQAPRRRRCCRRRRCSLARSALLRRSLRRE